MARLQMETTMAVPGDVCRYLAEAMNQSQLNALPVCEKSLQMLPEAVARENSVLPIGADGDTLHLVLPSDHARTDPPILEIIEFILNRKISYETANREHIAPLIALHYASAYATVTNCERRFVMRCPKRWAELESTKDSHVRFCEVCGKNVYFCQTENEIDQHAKMQHCIAVVEFDTSTETLGMPHTDD